MTPTLFHLHFNTPHVARAADRLNQAGIPLQQRFGSIRGDSASLAPEDERPDEFRLKLQAHQYGAVNITLAPGQRPHFDHFGLIVEDAENVLERAESRDWSVRSNERRTFIMTPWQFRIELHPETAEAVTGLDSSDRARLEDVTLCLPDASTAREAFTDVFGKIPELSVNSGEEPWIDSFSIVGNEMSSTVELETLLGS